MMISITIRTKFYSGDVRANKRRTEKKPWRRLIIALGAIAMGLAITFGFYFLAKAIGGATWDTYKRENTVLDICATQAKPFWSPR